MSGMCRCLAEYRFESGGAALDAAFGFALLSDVALLGGFALVA
jgi:hypothetical protein